MVSEAFWRRSVARILLRRVIAETRRRKYRQLKIRPVARNAAALHTFLALGFTIVGHVE
jgi:RimJ/RimL family protein N-acetyltransferase